MHRTHLEHLLRAASTISGERDVLVIGSQSILAALPEDTLPREATASIEADIAFLDDPAGWRERLVPLDTPATVPGRGLCLDPHDCVVAKLLAGREKDLRFAAALVRARLIDPALLAERLDAVEAHPIAVDRARAWTRHVTA